MCGKGWLLFVMASVLSADYCGCAFPRSNGGDPGDGVIVQLFRWRYEDVARECEQFLAPKGYAAVEVGPITEHWNLSTAPPKWDEPYYPVSYRIYSRSGDEQSFIEMVRRCNKAGIKVYVKVVLAYMANHIDPLTGYGGSKADGNKYDYPAVPYGASDFIQPSCIVNNTVDDEQMRSCDQGFDHHLNHTKPDVRQKLRNFLNKLISLGVAGFSVDAVNRIHPDHLSAIFSRLRYLNYTHGFSCETKPYIYQDFDSVKNSNDQAAKEYYALGRLADYQYIYSVSRPFNGILRLSTFRQTIRDRKDFLPNDKALVFVDEQSTQKSYLSYRISSGLIDRYIMGTAFMLAYPFGQPRILSSFDYEDPPIKDDVMEPVTFDGEKCTGKWNCEHRWPAIYNMVKFRDVVAGTDVTNTWTDNDDMFAFTRGNKGFILFNGYYWSYRLYDVKVQTGLPKGQYCDIISGKLEGNKCTGKIISVDENGVARFSPDSSTEISVTAIHVEAKLK